MESFPKIVIFVRCHALGPFVVDTIDSIRHYSVSNPTIVVTVDRNEELAQYVQQERPDVIPFVCHKVAGWGGGMHRLFCEAARWLVERGTEFDYLVNMDYDLIFTRSGADVAFLNKFDSPRVGMVGKVNNGSSHWKRKTRQSLPKLVTILSMIKKRIPPGFLPGDHCFTKDTKISLLDGTEASLEELLNKEDPFWVYSYDTERCKVVPGLAHSARKTGEKVSVLKVTLDNGESVRCTPDHLWMLRDGTYRAAKELAPGDSLMPLYRKYDGTNLPGYEQFYQSSYGWHFTHRLVCYEINGKPLKGDVCHHRDFNKRNNNPSNLQWLSLVGHVAVHWKYWSEEQRTAWSIKMKKLYKDNPELRRVVGDGVREAFARDPSIVERQKDSRRKKFEDPEYAKKYHDLHASMMKKTVAECWNDPEIRARWLIRQAESGRKAGRANFIAWNNRAKNIEFVCKFCGEKLLGNHRFAAHVENCECNPENTVELNCSFCGKSIRGRTKQTQHEAKCVCNKEGIKKLRIARLKKHLTKMRVEGLELTRQLFDLSKPRNCPKSSVAVELFGDWSSFVFDNHKVVSVEEDGFEDVYDITVEKYHNFALSAGVFVHNCAGAYNILKKNLVLQMYHDGLLSPPISDICDKVQLADDPLLSFFVACTGYGWRDLGGNDKAYIVWNMMDDYKKIPSKGCYLYHPTKIVPGNQSWSVEKELECRNFFRETRGQEPLTMEGLPEKAGPLNVTV